jgi:4-aminobutyrate aminotransferase-like enzyme
MDEERILGIDELWNRRLQVMGPGYDTFYERPVHIVRGEGVHLWDRDGKRYLDCYNNVASVGHCHPDVIAALTDQAGRLNTHTRYLHEGILEFAELLTSKLPAGLDVCTFACTGSEANDLALQMAAAVTGHSGHICTEASYHGNTKLVRALSTCKYEASERPDWLAVIEPPDLYRGPYLDMDSSAVHKYVAEVARACAELRERGHGVASLLVDSIYDCPGPYLAPPGYAEAMAAEVRAAGGLVIADEVQSGYTRTGGYWWGFEHDGIVPDIVTLGKPMGAGHPVSCVITTAEIAAEFAKTHAYFNTYGGNPVSMAVGRAVIEVIDRESLLENVNRVSEQLIAGLRDLAAKYDHLIGRVTGAGLFQGLDMVSDPERRTPMPIEDVEHLTSLVAEQGVLLGTTGRYGNVLKIRPPLVFNLDNVDQLLTTLDGVLASVSS